MLLTDVEKGFQLRSCIAQRLNMPNNDDACLAPLLIAALPEDLL